ncbi:UDP-N-acetylmuramoyl-L-alanine--D-glutamate ligase [Candidatus Cytomitobacter primus]|uniref:UDP-N-acetylmuramoyl-L-alanine--D-glutamate ligase n=1 Tax=Candidatus Cytomitobacter primus TaxID=2066024 RepID=A0A5C0UFD7_9PROT|nr:UDP-N-acetylmuramoyl-L-alanine--D-glutamate ligase [Candidatus Cytomitobacter primus]QEK38353.1 UDP-N-acetylmuramoyl-L-alanine--D-glutamate ligase [Candidatus Cytomitobacter primus]
MTYLLLGFGISNQSCAKILQANNQTFCIWDDDLKKRELAQKMGYRTFIINKINNNNKAQPNSNHMQSSNCDNATNHAQCISKIVLSPGIRSHPLLKLVANEQIYNEIDIFFQYSQNKNIKITCTGSFGKSTTVSLIEHILNANNIPAKAIGNLGCTVDNLKDNEIPIIELSSFQLERISTKFDIGVILNISKNHHLESYNNSYEDYANAKYKLATLSKYLLINENLTCKHQNNHYIHNAPENHIQNAPKQTIEFYQKYLHHIPYIAFSAAYNVCRKLSITPQDIHKACANFQTLAHRQEIVQNNPIIINDSKSTNLACSNYILQKHKISYWITGGVNSNICEQYIKDLPAQNIKHAFIIGENKYKLQKILLSIGINCSIYTNLEDAVICLSKNHQNETIIFSPGFKSFDLYKNFEERGKHFKALIKKHFK